MALRVSLSDPAENDLNAIYQYLAEAASPEIADYVVAGLFEAMRRTAAFPLSNRKRPDLAGFRRINVASFAIFYDAEPDGITIGRILHSRQDAQSHLDRDAA